MDDQPRPLSAPPKPSPARADRPRMDRPGIGERDRDEAEFLDDEARLRPRGPLDAPPRRRSGWSRALWLLIVLLVIAGLVAWASLRGGNQPAQTGRFQTSGPVPVGTTKVEKGGKPGVVRARRAPPPPARGGGDRE